MAKLSKIVLHWTAGSHFPSFYDKQFYHYLVDKEGTIHYGIYPPEANLDVSTGRYCAHCGGGNTGAIGIAFCAMAGFSPLTKKTKYPITSPQLEAGLKFAALLARKYDIPITQKTVFTHYEFGKLHPSSSSAGKIDITYLHPYPTVSAANVGGFLRQKIKWYKQS